MLRRAIQRAHLHLPAPITHDNGGGGSSSESEDFLGSPSVAYTTLRDDESVRDHFRKLSEDVTDVHLIVAEDAATKKKRNVAELSLDEQKYAADAWARLQTLYGLFRELEATADEDSDESDFESVAAGHREHREIRERRQRHRHDDGLRSLLQHVQLPPGVIFRDLETLAMTDGSDVNVMPQGFTANMFETLGNVMYKDMLTVAEQNRISFDAFEELGNLVYLEAARNHVDCFVK